MISAKGKFSLIGQKQLPQSILIICASVTQLRDLQLEDKSMGQEGCRVFIAAVKEVPPFSLHVHLQIGQDSSWLIELQIINKNANFSLVF